MLSAGRLAHLSRTRFFRMRCVACNRCVGLWVCRFGLLTQLVRHVVLGEITKSHASLEVRLIDLKMLLCHFGPCRRFAGQIAHKTNAILCSTLCPSASRVA